MDDFVQDQNNSATGSTAPAATQPADDNTADAQAMIALADELDKQAGEIEQTIAETSDEYEKVIQPDLQEIDSINTELENLNHEADLDEARGNIADAVPETPVANAPVTASTAEPETSSAPDSTDSDANSSGASAF